MQPESSGVPSSLDNLLSVLSGQMNLFMSLVAFL